MKSRAFLGFLLVASLFTIARADVVTAPALHQPANLSISIAQLRNYHDSGRYLADLAYVDAKADRFISSHTSGGKLAVVLDIDETALSNWPEMAADDFAYFPQSPCSIDRGKPTSPCGALAWDRLEAAAAIGPTLALFKLARAHGLTVFFITGRHESERAVTTRNLIRAGYVGWDPKHLLMEPDTMHVPSAADFKAPERKWIENKLGYTIVANVGDQWSDLAGGYAEGDFKLPNPFYHIP
ncbi:MAG: HAD family acid phosphatase [Steroidobacteraceae bacterium]